MISAGEVSGDQVGALLARSVKKRCDLDIVGLGGSQMKAAGATILQDTNLLGSVGLTEPLKTVPGVLETFLKIRRLVQASPPHAAVLIGHDVFHMILGRYLRAKKIPVVAYFPPQVWIWRSLARPISRCYDLVLTSFPEEEEIYKKVGAETLYVGHYLADRIAPADEKNKQKIRMGLGIGEASPIIGIFPGSRPQEISGLCPRLLDSAALIRERFPDARFVLAVADRSYQKHIETLVAKKGLTGTVVASFDSMAAMAASDLVLLCSGTATLQAAFMNVPMVVVYRVSAITWHGLTLVVKWGLMESKTMSLPNLVAGKKIVEELQQEQTLPENIAKVAMELLNDEKKFRKTQEELGKISRRMKRNGAVEQAAEAVLRAMARR